MAPLTPSEQVRTIESLRSERLPEYRFQFPQLPSGEFVLTFDN